MKTAKGRQHFIRPDQLVKEPPLMLRTSKTARRQPPKKLNYTCSIAGQKGKSNMKMELVSLKLENFKGQECLEFQFDGRNASIYGENATGKSTVYDSLTWLLFGKDSLGKKDFDIKPLTEDNSVRDHAAITSVEAVLRVDGQERKLKRTYYEVWSTKRGSAEASFDGHSSDYFVDDVPCKKNEFSRRVGEIIEENAFRLLTSITYFSAELPWQERRAALFDVAAVTADEEILASDARFAPLSAAMQGLALDDFRKKLTAQRKGLNKDRTAIPTRLDECKKTITELSRIDFAALERQKVETQSMRAAAQRELDQAEHDGGRTELQNQLVSIRNDLARLDNENAAHRLAQQQAQGVDEAAHLWQSLNAIRSQESRRQNDLKYLHGRRESLESDIASFRIEWDNIDRERFQGDTCPTCGQSFPQAKLDERKADFERKKDSRKAKAVAAANRSKDSLKNVQEEIAKLEQETAESQKQMEELSSRLRQLESVPKAEITDMDGYAFQKAGLEAQAAELQEKLDGLDKQSAARRKTLRDALADADRELDRLSGELAQKLFLERANRRMEELRAQAAAASDELNRLDGMLYLCDEFMRYKAKFIEESINRRFSLVRFRLVREQINGGLEDCCDVMVKGVPYASSLNNGAKVNAGIDIINTLSRHYNAQVPLFLDNAESVTQKQIVKPDTQFIRLVVSENDEELRCELA